MQETPISILPSNARKAYAEAPDSFKLTLALMLGGEDAFIDKRPITERIATIDDVFAYHKITSQEFNKACAAAGLSSDEEAYRLAKLTASALNEDWTPDFNNASEAKWFPYMEWNGSGFRFYGSVYDVRCSAVGSRLCFKSKELSDHYGKQFAPLINQFFL